MVAALPTSHNFAFDLGPVGIQPLSQFFPGRPLRLRRRDGNLRASAAPRGRRPLRRRHFDSGGCHRAVGGWRPTQRFECEGILDRRHQVARSAFIEPAGVAEIPRLEARVLEAPFGERGGGPLGGGLIIGRAGEARPVAVREHVQGAHDLGMRGLFRTDSGVYVLVGSLLGKEETTQYKSGEQLSHEDRVLYWSAGRPVAGVDGDSFQVNWPGRAPSCPACYGFPSPEPV